MNTHSTVLYSARATYSTLVNRVRTAPVQTSTTEILQQNIHCISNEIVYVTWLGISAGTE